MTVKHGNVAETCSRGMDGLGERVKPGNTAETCSRGMDGLGVKSGNVSETCSRGLDGLDGSEFSAYDSLDRFTNAWSN